MKIVSLNTWAGRELEALRDYVGRRGLDTDVFCFQEVFDTPGDEEVVDEHYRADLFSKLKGALPNHLGFYSPAQDGHKFCGAADFPISWGLAMFVRDSMRVIGSGDVFVKGYRNSKDGDNTTIPRNLQYVNLDVGGQRCTVAHFHGLWNGQGKTDTEERIEQSRKVRQVFDGFEGKKILCGDFNLLPDTESLRILEDGNDNLIRRYGIRTTRSLFYGKSDKFADYAIVSPDVRVLDFRVPSGVVVSDHLPMEIVVV